MLLVISDSVLVLLFAMTMCCVVALPYPTVSLFVPFGRCAAVCFVAGGARPVHAILNRTGSIVDETTWGALCARLKPNLGEDHYAALRAMKGTDRLQLQDMVERSDDVSTIILFIDLALPAAGKRKRNGGNAGAVAQNASVGAFLITFS